MYQNHYGYTYTGMGIEKEKARYEAIFVVTNH